VAGWLQGAIRQIISIAAFLLAFLIAANLREPLGAFLARNWTFNDPGFNFLLAWLGLWLAWGITFQIAIQSFYTRILINQRFVILDEVLGGLLAVLQVLLVLALVTIIFDAYYLSSALPDEPRDAAWARTLAGLMKDSAIVGALRGGLIPALLSVFRVLLPPDVTATPS
jgi:uncharacterized membrane protein required for colicin V production